MEDVLNIVRSFLTSPGAVVLYSDVLDAVQKAGKNDQLLPGAIYQLKAEGFLRKEVGKRTGDDGPKYRLVRTG
jgi:hypothetical protein